MSTKNTLDIILGHVSLACAEILRERGETEGHDGAAQEVLRLRGLARR